MEIVLQEPLGELKMSSGINNRKVQHIQIVNAEEGVDRRGNYFDRIRLVHRALPELDLKRIDPSIQILGKRLSFPLLISSMTGGDDEMIRSINYNLAVAAERTGVAMAVGSQRVMFTNPSARKSFDLRPLAPTALLLSNLGAVQLNYGLTLEMCREAMAVLSADALVLHLNPLQEAVQPEGDTDFSGLADKIVAVAKGLEKPIILKEVGCGFSPADMELVIRGGIHYIDVAGAGGTSWSRVEHHRQTDPGSGSLGVLFQDWGLPTPRALNLLRRYTDRMTLIASGGVRSGLDMVKAAVLGASLSGVAAPLLKPAMVSADEVVTAIEKLRSEFVTAMFLLGVGSVAELVGNLSLVEAPRCLEEI